MKKKKSEPATVEPAKFEGPLDKVTNLCDVTRKVLFDYLKENLTIDVDCCENWGYYENGEVSVTVNLYLKNPETGNNELVSSSTGNA